MDFHCPIYVRRLFCSYERGVNPTKAVSNGHGGI